MSAIKTVFEKARTIGPLHTGGPVAVSSDGQYIVTCVGEEALLSRLSDGEQLNRFASDSETIYSLCLTPSSSHLALFSATHSLCIYENPIKHNSSGMVSRPSRTIARAHDAPVHVCKVDPTSTLLASGSADGIVRVWDISRGYATHIFKGHGGIVSALVFRYVLDTTSAVNTQTTLQLISASADTRLRIFDLSNGASHSSSLKSSAVLEGHVSVPRGLAVSPDGRWLISGGRDSVVLLWDFAGEDSKGSRSRRHGEKTSLPPVLARTLPVYERVEAVGWITDDSTDFHIFTAGEKGAVKIWDVFSNSLLYAFNEGLGEAVEEQRGILDACFIAATASIMSVHADQNILFHSVQKKSLSQQLIGFNDEVVAATFLSENSLDSHLAIAANSSLIRVYNIEANDARLLSGHSSIVLSLDHSPDKRMLASGSRDNTARIWRYSSLLKNWICAATCEGHAESVGAVALSRRTDGPGAKFYCPRWLFTGSQDKTIKMWDLSDLPLEEDRRTPHRLRSLCTQKAHDKDINSLDVSSNDRFLASGSQDRTAKVYEIACLDRETGRQRADIKLLGTCKGHKRGVWAVKFGKVEKILASGSGDKTVKLWNLDDFSCIKTFEGHTNSVLQVGFFNEDQQIASSASDGLLKLWNARTEECVATLDNHEHKVWALAISSKENLIATGAADSKVTLWKDCTLEKERQQLAERERLILSEQDLKNYIHMKDYKAAASLALRLEQPGHLYSLIRTIISESDEGSAGSNISAILHGVPDGELVTLLSYIRNWNTNNKTSDVAQHLLHALLKLRTVESIIDAFLAPASSIQVQGSKSGRLSVSELVHAMIPYTERHLMRLERLIQDSYALDYVLGEMDDGLVMNDDDMQTDAC